MLRRERSAEASLEIMNQLETLLLKKGWPVPFTPYYLVNHERMLILLDKLRLSMQDDMDARFLQAFGTAEFRETSRKALIGKER